MLVGCHQRSNLLTSSVRLLGSRLEGSLHMVQYWGLFCPSQSSQSLCLMLSDVSTSCICMETLHTRWQQSRQFSPKRTHCCSAKRACCLTLQSRLSADTMGMLSIHMVMSSTCYRQSLSTRPIKNCRALNPQQKSTLAPKMTFCNLISINCRCRCRRSSLT